MRSHSRNVMYTLVLEAVGVLPACAGCARRCMMHFPSLLPSSVIAVLLRWVRGAERVAGLAPHALPACTIWRRRMRLLPAMTGEASGCRFTSRQALLQSSSRRWHDTRGKKRRGVGQREGAGGEIYSESYTRRARFLKRGLPKGACSVRG